ncbi:uncharacterized protein LOC8279216 [Ricinus communis]|uniref:uncharacterized protein LOC8279216 n=1 Tax=Ricinus communis TaxID=3988 RepID=UPI00201B2B6B|nr:uncharacterized protein LOC8279216 [Ricinus communis]
MGLMGLLFKVAVECFDVLAWPLFALGYPLYASVQAIESNSKSDTRKLITYWVCFSLLLLLEHALAKQLNWLSYWLYIKLTIVGCLVVPRFDGSFYVYKHIVHPYLSMDPHVVLNWFIKLKQFLNQDNLLVEVKSESKETAPDALVNLAGSFTAFKGRQIEPDFGLSRNRPSVEIKEMTYATISGRDFDILPSKKVQKEWTCAVCQITTTSETDLILHLQGRQHENACEKLNSKNQASNAKTPASAKTNVLLDSKEMGISTIAGSDTPDKQHLKGVQKMLICSVCQETATSVTDFISHLRGNRHVDACGKPKAKEQTLKSNVSLSSASTNSPSDPGCNLPNILQSNSTQSPWTCAICEVITTRKMDLISHFQGKRHEDALDKLKVKIETSRRNIFPATMETSAPPENKGMAGSNHPDELHGKNFQQPWTCGICEVTVQGEATILSHLQGRRHVNACEKLKTPVQTPKRAISPVSIGNQSN